MPRAYGESAAAEGKALRGVLGRLSRYPRGSDGTVATERSPYGSTWG